MSCQKKLCQPVKAYQQGAKLVNPGKGAFADKTLAIDVRVKQTLTSALAGVLITTIDGNVGNNLMIEAHPSRRFRIKGTISIEDSARYLQAQPLHVFECGCQMPFEFKGIVMVASDNTGGGDNVAVALGDGQDVAGLGPLARLVGDLLTAFLSRGMTAIQVELRQVELGLQGDNTLLPDPVETAIGTPFAEVIAHRAPANFLFWGWSAAGAIGSCAHWQPVCKRYRI